VIVVTVCIQSFWKKTGFAHRVAQFYSLHNHSDSIYNVISTVSLDTSLTVAA